MIAACNEAYHATQVAKTAVASSVGLSLYSADVLSNVSNRLPQLSRLGISPGKVRLVTRLEKFDQLVGELTPKLRYCMRHVQQYVRIDTYWSHQRSLVASV